MILSFFLVLSVHAKNHHKQMLQRSRANPYLGGGENLKGFGHLVMENEHLQVEDSESSPRSQCNLLKEIYSKS